MKAIEIKRNVITINHISGSENVTCYTDGTIDIADFKAVDFGEKAGNIYELSTQFPLHGTGHKALYLTSKRWNSNAAKAASSTAPSSPTPSPVTPPSICTKPINC